MALSYIRRATRKMRAHYLAIGAGVVVLVALLAFGPRFYLRAVIDPAAVQRTHAFEQAKALHASGNHAQATKEYLAAIQRYHGVFDVTPHVDAYLRLYASYLPSPCSPSHLEQGGWLVTAFRSLPPSEQTARARTFVVERLVSCADDLDPSRIDDAYASLFFLDQAAALAAPASQKDLYVQRTDRIRLALARRLESDRPLAALTLFVETTGLPALDRAKSIIDSLGSSPSLWVESASAIEMWIRRSREAGRGSEAEEVERRLLQARREFDAIRAEVGGADANQLRELLERNPTQPATVALAKRHLGRGASTEAFDLLRTLLPLGRMTAEAQLVLARCLLEMGDHEQADTVLWLLLRERLPAFHMEVVRLSVPIAKSDYAPEDAQAAELRRGVLPDLVPRAAIQLGFVRLSHANFTHADERRMRLEAAERAFLVARPGASNVIEYHVGLGMTYRRLGKAEASEAHFRKVVERQNPAAVERMNQLVAELESRSAAAGHAHTNP